MRLSEYGATLAPLAHLDGRISRSSARRLKPAGSRLIEASIAKVEIFPIVLGIVRRILDFWAARPWCGEGYSVRPSERRVSLRDETGARGGASAQACADRAT